MASKKKTKAVETHETYTLRITPLDAPEVYRAVEVPASYTLGDVHAVIQVVFELDDDQRFAFFMTNEAWDKKGCYTGEPDKAWEHDAWEAPLSSLQLEVGKTFLYVFDFEDEVRHSLEVVAKGTVNAARTYPHLVDAKGKVAHEGDDEEEEEPLPLAPEHEPLVPELVACLEEYDEHNAALDEDEEDALAPETLERHLVVARRLIEALRPNPEQYEAFLDRIGEVLDEWLASLPFDLVELERADEAVAFIDAMDPVLYEQFGGTRMTRAAIYAKVGRLDEARAFIEETLAAHADDPLALEDAASLYDELEDSERAEPLWRKLYELNVFPFSEDARERLGLPPPPPPQKTVVNDASKVGRNDPCPCGSGKKFKKCCG